MEYICQGSVQSEAMTITYKKKIYCISFISLEKGHIAAERDTNE